MASIRYSSCMKQPSKKAYPPYFADNFRFFTQFHKFRMQFIKVIYALSLEMFNKIHERDY